MANNTYGIFENTVFMEEMVFNEAFRSPLKKRVEALKKIKETSPKEYDGPADVKEFVDKHYDEIVKCANILEKKVKIWKRIVFVIYALHVLFLFLLLLVCWLLVLLVWPLLVLFLGLSGILSKLLR